MKYYLKTENGYLSNDKGEILYFDSHTEARQCVINYCDLSDKSLCICVIDNDLDSLVIQD